jgi:hypothetical protein
MTKLNQQPKADALADKRAAHEWATLGAKARAYALAHKPAHKNGHKLGVLCVHLREGWEFKCFKVLEWPGCPQDSGVTYLCEACWSRFGECLRNDQWSKNEFDLLDTHTSIECLNCLSEKLELMTVMETHDVRNVRIFLSIDE